MKWEYLLPVAGMVALIAVVGIRSVEATARAARARLRPRPNQADSGTQRAP